mmetsp:Transcript_70978/g.140936  ORF Transcript_70978/g.140936 Transcript_70978/m.140936 type:complete len:298 (+) Transcript_70978:1288-2181(+)
MPSPVIRLRVRISSEAIGWLEHVRYFEIQRTPSLVIILPVKRRTSQRMPCFSSMRKSAFTPTTPSSFSEKSTLVALKRLRAALPSPDLSGRSAVRRRSIQAHHLLNPLSPSPISGMETESRCGCPGLAGSIVQRVAQSGCSSSMAPTSPFETGSLLSASAGVFGVASKELGGGPEGWVGRSFGFLAAGPDSALVSPIAAAHFCSNCLAQVSLSKIPSSSCNSSLGAGRFSGAVLALAFALGGIAPPNAGVGGALLVGAKGFMIMRRGPVLGSGSWGSWSANDMFSSSPSSSGFAMDL